MDVVKNIKYVRTYLRTKVTATAKRPNDGYEKCSEPMTEYMMGPVASMINRSRRDTHIRQMEFSHGFR